MPNERLLTVPEVMDRLKRSRHGVYDLINSGELRSLVVGQRSRRIPESELERYIAERLVTAVDK